MARAKTLSPEQVEHLERTRTALRLRAQGMRWADIARETGFPSLEAAIMAVKRLLAKEVPHDVESARALHRERLETLIRAVMLPAINPGAALKVARESQQPAPMAQDKAIELLRRLLDDLAKVEGVYQPIKAEISGPDGGPIETQRTVVVWQPTPEELEQMAYAMRELPPDVQPKLVGPGADDPTEPVQPAQPDS